MNRSLITTALAALLSFTGCAHSLPRSGAAAARAPGFALPLLALSGAGRRVCAVDYADPVQCMYIDGGRTNVVDVPGTEGAIDVVVTETRGCALFGSGVVACFGWDDDGTTHAALVPGLDDAFEVAVSDALVCGRSESGHVRCARHDEPAVDVRELAGAAEVAVYGSRGCARTGDGEVWCWTAASPIAARVPELGGVVSLAGGASGLFAMTSAGELLRLDDWGTPEWRFGTPVGSFAGGQRIAVGPGGACAETTRHETLCWSATSGRITQIDRLDDARELVMGDRFACGVSSDGAMHCAALGVDALHARATHGRLAASF